MLTSSLFPTPRREKYSCVTTCNMCNICKNYMVFSSTFVSTVTGKKYYIRGNFTCNSTNVIYLAECINCKCQYVESATSFKHFRIHKSNIKTKTDHCGTARHFNSICCHPINPCHYRKSNLLITTLYFNYLRIYTCGVARTNQMSKEKFFCEHSQLFHKNISSLILVCSGYTTVYI